MNHKELAHDRLADHYDEVINHYDTNRRIEVLIDEFWAGVDLHGKLVLDAGCGAGHGTKRLLERGARVIAFDLGMNMVKTTRRKYTCLPTVGSVTCLPFAENTFQFIFSTEVIEHTPDPLLAIQEMLRVLKPDGHLVLSTPNWLWQLPVRAASMLRLRPFDGLENFVKPKELSAAAKQAGGIIQQHRGIHLLPFQLTFLQALNRRMDDFGAVLLPFMINQCIHVIKASGKEPPHSLR